ncbi:MAG TPA: redoxin domain-containing protein [Tepidisphaeraceae bacterium]|jgi:peroxiredoxin|nr:redoxin domain-containing protein [Tepidisphaeraceae bacterium]
MRRITSLVLLAAFAVLAAAVIAPAEEKSSAAVGKSAPAFQLQDQGGKTINLADQSGKVVVLEWWNNECPIDARHYTSGEMNKLASKWTDKGVVWLAINSTHDKTNADNKKAGDAWHMERPILNDASGDIGHEYGATNTPHMFVIDSSGKVVYMGAIDNNPDGDKTSGVVNYVDQALTQLASGTSVSQPQTRAYGCSVKYAK